MQRIDLPAVLAICLLSFLGGCRDPNPKPFLGTWALAGEYNVRSESGSTIQTLSGRKATPVPGFWITFRMDPEVGLTSVDSYGCVLRWGLSGSTAELLAGQHCSVLRGKGSAQLLLEEGSIEVTPAGPSQLAVNGRIAGVVEQGGRLFGTALEVSAEVHGSLSPVQVGKSGETSLVSQP